MKLGWLFAAVLALIGLGAVAADPAAARTRHKAKPPCADRAVDFSWWRILDAPAPRPNGCTPPVFVDGEFIGQDPDSRVRFQLMRDPDTGYKQHN